MFADAQAVEPLIVRLQDDAPCLMEKFKDLLVCDIAAQALRRIGTPEALTALQKNAADNDSDAKPPAAQK